MKARPYDIRNRIEARRKNSYQWVTSAYFRYFGRIFKDRDFYLDDCN